MRYSLGSLRNRIRSARRRRERKRLRDQSYRARMESLESRVLLAHDVMFGFFGVAENSADGTGVGTVKVSGATAPTFAITAGNDDVDGDSNPAFRINSTTGLIRVNDSTDLDFETQPNFALTVTVTDGGHTDSNFQVISLSDVAENLPPAFDPESIGPFTIGENSATAVGTLTATDPEGDTLIFSLADAGNADVDADGIRAFGINASTGAITVTDPDDVNFEGAAPNPTYTLTATVTDDGQGGLSDTATVTVNIANENDSPVIANQTYSVPENTANKTKVATVKASDEDVGESLTYTLAPNAANDVDGDGKAPFAVNASTGAITVNDSDDLNFEVGTNTFMLNVTVRDNHQDGSGTAEDPFVPNSASASAVVTINLIDVVENLAPVATDNQTFSIPEGSPVGSAVLPLTMQQPGRVVASDADGDSLTYSILPGTPGNPLGGVDLDGNNAFVINPTTGVITVNDSGDLDNDNTPLLNPGRYELEVVVTDSGEDSLTDQTTVTIVIGDVNDAPVAPDAMKAVKENAPPGALVVGALVGSKVSASDPNGDTLTYSLMASKNAAVNLAAFNINASSGQITVKDPSLFDFETTDLYTLTVTVTDDGFPAASVDATITVQVQNVLENNPPVATDGLKFPVAQGATFPEHSPADVPLGWFAQGSDPNVFPGQIPNPQTLSYSITGGNPGDAFMINESTGEIRVANPAAVDFETNPVFALEVTVADNGEAELSDTTIVTINLGDVNDSPVIPSDQLGLISETALLNAPVTSVPFGSPFRVQASDEDLLPVPDTLSYSIVSEVGFSNDVVSGFDPTGAFGIHAGTGALFVADPSKIDYDRLVIPPVNANDPLPTVTVQVGVNVIDNVGGSTTNMMAATIIIRNEDDNTPPVGTNRAGFVFNVNDDLTFTGNEDTGTCSAQLNPGHDILFLTCSTDSMANGSAEVLDLASGNTLVSSIPILGGQIPAFIWNQSTTIPNPAAGTGDPPAPPTLARPFNAAALQSVLTDNAVLIMRFDNGDGNIAGRVGLASDPAAKALIIDEKADGVDNLSVGAVVGSVVASDPEGYPLSYEITGGNVNVNGNKDVDGNAILPFAIDNMGRITVNDPGDLDADTMPQFNLTVTITDAPTVPLLVGGLPSETPDSADVSIEINLRDLNDRPDFLPAGHKPGHIVNPPVSPCTEELCDIQFGSVLENAVPGLTKVGVPVAVFDGDGDSLTYSIDHPAPGTIPFAINSSTGQISVSGTKGDIDFETQSAYDLTIRVSDGKGLTDTGLFKVLVLNQPENEPPIAPTRINDFDPIFGGVTFELTRDQTVPLISEENHPGSSGTCTVTFTPEQVPDLDLDGSFTISCAHDVANPTAAHIHMGAPGVAGPVLIPFASGASPLTLTIDETLGSPTFTDFATSLLAGELYVNVHSAAFPSGEIRGNIPAPQQDQLTVDESVQGAPTTGTIGTYVGASDPDFRAGDDPISYSITGGNTDLDGDGVGPFAINESTGNITIADSDDLDYESTDQFFLEISVTDGPQADVPATSKGMQQININDVNDPPAIAPIFDLFSPLDQLELDVNGVDPDREQEFLDSFFDVLSIDTTGMAPPAIDPEVIVDLGLFVDGDLFFNFFGAGEKYLRAAPAGPAMTMDWYLILPSGEFIRWDGSDQPTGQSLGFFGNAAYSDPVGEIVEKMRDPGTGAAPAYPLPTEDPLMLDLDMTGFGLGDTDKNTFTITRLSGAGTATVEVEVCDVLGACDTDIFDVIYGENAPPVLESIGNQVSGPGDDQVVIDLAATDSNPGTLLTFGVELKSIEFQLDSQLDFFVDGSDFRNVFGSDERWVRSRVDNQWYFVLPDNRLIRWNGSASATGTLIGQLNAGVHSNLNLITSPTAGVNATAELVGNQLTITKNPGFFGLFFATVTVSDGGATDEETFTVTFTDV